jgi:hypothetical protein
LGVLDLGVENLAAPGTFLDDSRYVVGYDTTTNTGTFTVPADIALPDGNYRATLFGLGVRDAAGNAVVGDHVLEFFVLRGDANRDRRVDVTDLGAVSTNFNKPGDWSRGDFDGNGRVDVTDLGIVASNFNKSLDEPDSPPIAAGAAASAAPAPSVRPAFVPRARAVAAAPVGTVSLVPRRVTLTPPFFVSDEESDAK